MLFLTRGRPLLRAAVGVAVVVAGLFFLTRILLTLGSILIVWGVAGAIVRWRSRDRDTELDDTELDETPGR